MALIGCDGFDIYDDANIGDFWTTIGANATINTTAGRCGGGAYQFNSAAGSGPSIGVNTSVDGGYCGFARYVREGDMNRTLFSVNGSGGNAQIVFQIRANGAVECWSGPVFGALDSRFLCTTPPGLVTEDHWYHLGFEWICATTGGYVKIWVNNVLQASTLTDHPLPAGLNTRSGTLFAASSPWRHLHFGGGSGMLDDVYWGDSSGSVHTTFLGDLRVEGQLALDDSSGGGGTYQDFLPSTGTDHGALVDDPDPDDDATYLASDTPGDMETLKFPNISLAAGVVYGVQLMPNVLKTDAGPRLMACVVRQGGTDTVGTDQGPSQESYTYKWQMFETNPTTGTTWTATTTNNMEGGVKVTA